MASVVAAVRCGAILDQATRALILVGLTLLLPAAHAREQRVPLGESTGIVMDVPADWKKSIDYPAEKMPPIIRLTSSEKSPGTVLITPLWSPARDPAFNALPSVRAVVERSARGASALPLSVAVSLKEFRQGDVRGYYFTAFDDTVKRGENRYLTQGAIALADLMITFSIWAPDPDSTVVKRVFEMLATTRRQ